MRTRLACAALVLSCIAGCTGVPGSSHPETIQHLGGTQAAAPVAPPQDGTDPRSLVQGFLDANIIDAGNRGAARPYLTPVARNRWTDATVTVLNDYQVGQFDGGTVTARGNQVATVDANGVYTPDPHGIGNGGEAVQFAFTLKTVSGQYRIDKLKNGLVLNLDGFHTAFTQRTLYFYDAEEHYLVPDVRYSALGDPQLAASWLIGQLLLGPRDGLQNAESNLEWPPQATPGRVLVKVGNVTSIEVPGASKIPAAQLGRLAAQLACTLADIEPAGLFSITDGGKPVSIPAIGGTQFSAAEFSSSLGPQEQLESPTLYYVRDGGVVDANGQRLPGDIGNGHLQLKSVALARLPTSTQLYIAATAAAGSGNAQQLLVGTATTGLKKTALIGQLTRPSWVPGFDEVWIANGTTLFRATSAGHVTQVPLLSLPPNGQIRALRVSPDGSRLALVIATEKTTTSQAYIGTLDRGSGQVQVDALASISPEGVHVDDVAWNDPVKLFLIGTTQTVDARIIEVQVDGSLWTARGAPQLPGPPDSITIAENLPAWVSVDGSVWQQSGGSWISPNDPGQTLGSQPIYLE